MRHVIIVVPCYNEEQRLDVETFLNLPSGEPEIELLFVNDGSRDGTLGVLEAMKARQPRRFDVLDLQPNRGKAEAVRNGMLKALEKRPDYIGFLDADLATPLSELARFCEILETRPDVDIVFGSRVKLLGRTIERKAYRHYFGRVFATAVSAVLGISIYDSQCGAKLFRADERLREVFSMPFLSRWIFDVEIIARYRHCYAREGIEVADRIYELPLFEWRDVHGSKVKPRDAFRAGIDLLKIKRAYPEEGTVRP